VPARCLSRLSFLRPRLEPVDRRGEVAPADCGRLPLDLREDDDPRQRHRPDRGRGLRHSDSP